MARKKKTTSRRPIESYQHQDKQRVNNPPVGLVTPETDPDAGAKKTYAYDPHLDPQLVWAGKAEHTSFEVPTVSLHVHERIDPRTIIEAVRRVNSGQSSAGSGQLSLFEQERKEPLREAIEFYKHKHGWSNRLVAGDSLLVMNSLLEKEGLAGKVQMIYIDPPYGIRYGSNFQPFVNKRDVKDGKDEDLTAEPEQIRAFRDTWKLGIHSYLSYLRDRLLLARELLTESGSIFVQISDENVHHVRELMDEVFGAGSFVSFISFSTTSGFASLTLSRAGDYLVWYAKDKAKIKYRQLYNEKIPGEEGATKYKSVESHKSIPDSWWPKNKLVSVDSLTSQGPTESETRFEIEGKAFHPPKGMHWKTTVDGLHRLLQAKRVVIEGNSPRFLRFLDDFPVYPINNLWTDIGGVQNRIEGKLYVVQTATSAIARCLLMTTDPGDLVFDPTCVREGTLVLTPLNPPEIGGRQAGDLIAEIEGKPFSLPDFGEGRGGGKSDPEYGEGQDGVKTIQIELLNPGDFVYTHTGQPRRVIRAIKRKYSGKMIGIRHENSDKILWVTADHRVLMKVRDYTFTGRRDWSHNVPTGFEKARQLRKNSTPAEKLLWSQLRNQRLGVKFRRQHPIGPYIVDFHCPERALIVELER